jgi:hypothetical protein
MSSSSSGSRRGRGGGGGLQGCGNRGGRGVRGGANGRGRGGTCLSTEVEFPEVFARFIGLQVLATAHSTAGSKHKVKSSVLGKSVVSATETDDQLPDFFSQEGLP